jgi:hypothetical protein
MVDVDYAKKCPAPTINIKDEADPTLILTLDPKKGAENVRDMAQHLVDHVCVICTQQFQTTEDLKKHFWDHDENIGQVGCLFCKVAFPTKEDLVDHIMGGCNTWGDATPEPKTAARPVGPAALLGTSLLFYYKPYVNVTDNNFSLFALFASFQNSCQSRHSQRQKLPCQRLRCQPQICLCRSNKRHCKNQNQRNEKLLWHKTVRLF